MNEHNSRFWTGETSRRIEQRIIVEADLVLETPAHFGDGDANDFTDMPLLICTDVNGKTAPLLTGATLTGALRAYLNNREFGFRANATKPYALSELLFGAQKGDEEDNGRQSALIIEDAFGQASADMEMRENVKLDNATRTAHTTEVTVNGQKFRRGELFDMQLWPIGTTFPIRFELLLMQTPRQMKMETGEYQAKVKEAFLIALDGLTDGSITLGARKNRGLGRIALENWRVKAYDLKNDLYAWLESGYLPLAQLNEAVLTHPKKAEVFEEISPRDNREWLEIELTCRLDPSSSLLIRDSGGADSGVDAVHLRSSGQPILSGTSLTGALRARAQRIVHLVYPDNPKTAQRRLDALFGSDLHIKQGDNTTGKKRNQNAKASRLIVEEHVIEDAVVDRVQNRVSIDRFTGGARDTALFSEQPLFGTKETRVKVKWRLLKPVAANNKKGAGDREFKAQIGLLLLLLKDLWTADLPVGGEISVGRGRLQGIKAEIKLYQPDKPKPQTWTIQDGTRPDNYHQLQTYVDALWEEVSL
ncbi:MAG: hypothetical protein H6658_09840 [Ardenticatenaceae bacterium]|nr:hypothetical protein [Ardenticatenaceae bacterium]